MRGKKAWLPAAALVVVALLLQPIHGPFSRQIVDLGDQIPGVVGQKPGFIFPAQYREKASCAVSLRCLSAWQAATCIANGERRTEIFLLAIRHTPHSGWKAHNPPQLKKYAKS